MAWKVRLIDNHLFPTFTAARFARLPLGLTFCRRCHHKLTPPDFKLEDVRFEGQRMTGTMLLKPQTCPRCSNVITAKSMLPKGNNDQLLW